MIKIYNQMGQIVGTLKDNILQITHIDLKVAMKDYDGGEDLTKFLEEKGFRFG